MEGRDFVRAIIDGWDDPMPMLVFADWLEERGQPDRATLLRAGAAMVRVLGLKPFRGWQSWVHQGRWERCRPDWWFSELRSDRRECGLRTQTGRGLARVVVSSKFSADQLVAWPELDRAVGEGWVESIVLDGIDAIDQSREFWGGAIRDVAVDVHQPANPIERAGRLLRLPRLRTLDLGSYGLPLPIAVRLPDWRHLQQLVLGLPAGMPRGDIRATMEAIAGIGSLRTLELRPASNLDDDDLAPLGRMVGLGELNIGVGPRLTDRSLDHFRHLPRLRHLKFFQTPQVTDRKIDELRQAMPGTTIGLYNP